MFIDSNNFIYIGDDDDDVGNTVNKRQRINVDRYKPPQTTISSSLKTLEERIDRLECDIDVLNSDDTSLKTSIDVINMKEQLICIRTREIPIIKQDIATLQQVVINNTNEISSLQSKRSVVREDGEIDELDELKDQVKQLSSQLYHQQQITVFMMSHINTLHEMIRESQHIQKTHHETKDKLHEHYIASQGELQKQFIAYCNQYTGQKSNNL